MKDGGSKRDLIILDSHDNCSRLSNDGIFNLKVDELPFIKNLGANGEFLPKLGKGKIKLFEDGTIG